MKSIVLFLVVTLVCCSVSAQDSLVGTGISTDIFLDVYYSNDFNNPKNHEKPSFLYNYNRHNEFNVNLALAKCSYSKNRLRGTVGLMTGTYAQYNLAPEPVSLRFIYEANAGVKISSVYNLWVDAGIMPSHIGYESAISKDCWTLTRSMAAENSPYYETGAKVTFISDNEQLLASVLILNGWQRISRTAGNNTPAFGTQVIMKFPAKITFNWSSFIGNTRPDSAQQWRYFHNFFAIAQLKKTGITAGFDIGVEQQLKSKRYKVWYTPSVVVRYMPDEHWAIAARAEYYHDPDGLIISANNRGFETYSFSLNADRTISKNALWRIEVRGFESSEPVFERNGSWVKEHVAVTTSLSLSF